MGNIERAIEFTDKVAERLKLKSPFSKVAVTEGGVVLDGVYELRIDGPALKSFSGAVGKALEKESKEIRNLVTTFLEFVNHIQEDCGQEISRQQIN